MRGLNVAKNISKKMYSTPTFHKNFNCKKNRKNIIKNEDEKLRPKESYLYMYSSLPLKNINNIRINAK